LLKVVEASMNDYEQWDVFSRSQQNVFQSFEFLNVLQRVNSLSPKLLIAYDGESILGGMIIIRGHVLKVFSEKIVQMGPIIKPCISKEFNKILRILLTALRSSNRNVIDIHIRTPFKQGAAAFKSFSFVPKDETLDGSVLIDLTKDEETLWRELAKRCRNAVRKASKSGVNVEELSSLEEVSEYYRLYSKAAYAWSVPYPYSLFKGVFELLVPKGLARFFLAKYKDQAIAGLVNLIYNGKVFHWNNILSPEYRSLSPNNLLMWYAICANKRECQKIYYIYGLPPVKSKHGYSTFKTSFGGTLIDDSRGYFIVNSSIKKRIIDKSIKLSRYRCFSALSNPVKKLLIK